MHRTIVIAFSTVDGITNDPDGSARSPVIVAGSTSVVHALAARNLVDEYRILIFPELVGQGTRLFTHQTVPAQLRLVSAEIVGPAVLNRSERAAV